MSRIANELQRVSKRIMGSRTDLDVIKVMTLFLKKHWKGFKDSGVEEWDFLDGPAWLADVQLSDDGWEGTGTYIILFKSETPDWAEAKAWLSGERGDLQDKFNFGVVDDDVHDEDPAEIPYGDDVAMIMTLKMEADDSVYGDDEEDEDEEDEDE